MHLTLLLAQTSAEGSGGGAGLLWVVVLALLAVVAAGAAGAYWLRARLREVESTRAAAALQSEQEHLRANELARQNEYFRDNINRLQDENRGLRVKIKEPPALPPITKQVYTVATIGIDTCGKTALTRKWADPTLTIANVQATKFDSYEKMVHRQIIGDRMIEHTFQILDWGGEYLVTAQEQLVTLGELRALIFVVDLGEYDTKQKKVVFSQARIERQLSMFAPNLLPFFFGERIASHCRTCVLFINKSDVLAGSVEAIEQEAKQHFSPLIQRLDRLCEDRGVELEIKVGSAITGHNTHELFGYLQAQLLEEVYQTTTIHDSNQGVPTEIGSANSTANLPPRRNNR